MPLPSTMIPIATTTLGSDQSSVTFSSIPATYTDLLLVFNGKSDANTAAFYYRFNSDSASNYSSTHLKGDGSTAASDRYSNATYLYALGNGFQNETAIFTHFMNYANTTTYKTALTRWSSLSAYVAASVGLWRSTSAINRIDIYAVSTNVYKAGATFTLYGIKAA